MSTEKYVAPEMDIIEFGNEDLVCNISGTNVGNYGGSSDGNYGIDNSTGTWDGTDQPET